MFQNRIPALAKEQGINNAFQLGKALGVSPTTANKLWTGDFSKVGVDTLHRLCELFDCQIGDYLHFDGNRKDSFL